MSRVRTEKYICHYNFVVSYGLFGEASKYTSPDTSEKRKKARPERKGNGRREYGCV